MGISMRELWMILLLLTTSIQSVWAAGCYIEIGTSSSSNGTTTSDLNIPTTVQAPLANTSSVVKTSANSAITYWDHSNGSVNAGEAATVRFSPAGTTFTVDSSNKKGWLVDSSIPGLYFTLEANLPKPPQGPLPHGIKQRLTCLPIPALIRLGFRLGMQQSCDENGERHNILHAQLLHNLSI
jgi:hypothetical protein